MTMAVAAVPSVTIGTDKNEDQSVSDDIIRPGDLCILQITQGKQLMVKVKEGAVIQTRHGAVPHDFLIGRRFGAKVTTKNKRGFVHALRLTPELWTLNLPHRTQVIYHHDISLIITMLDLAFGRIVIECGTGSGSLSHSLIRAVMPYGHLFTYEFHKERAKKARREFDEHGVGEHVTVTHADVLDKGFGLQRQADAVMLDLPMCERAVVHAKAAMKPGARLCSFSPCIEQVQRMSIELHNQGFTDIQTFECSNRELQPTTVALQQPSFLCTRQTSALESRSRNLSDKSDSPKAVTAQLIDTADSKLSGSADGDSTCHAAVEAGSCASASSTGNGRKTSPGLPTAADSSQDDSAEMSSSPIGLKRQHEQEDEERLEKEPERKRQSITCLTEQAEKAIDLDSETESKEATANTDTSKLKKNLPWLIPPTELSTLRIVNWGKRSMPFKKQPSQKDGDSKEDEPTTASVSSAVFRTAFRSGKMPGHTGYLTFASCGLKVPSK